MASLASILCITEFFKPGYKGGGPTRSVSGLVRQLHDTFDFKIFTRDRDLGDTVPYRDIEVNSWQQCNECSVYYASPKSFSLWNITKMVQRTRYDILYLNSFFNFRASILPNLVHHSLLRRSVPVIIAPRGEFSPGSLSQKTSKKLLFLRLARSILPYRNCYWQATTDIEREYISKALSIPNERIFVAANIPDLALDDGHANQSQTRLCGTKLRIIFLSRISPEKNLLFLLKALRYTKAEIELNIYGPLQDHAYWRRCQATIEELPGNLEVQYHGQVEHAFVRKVFRENDLFVFPSCGENFGHVIFESLAAGTCVITSDQTPWQTAADGSIEVLPLQDVNVWSKAIENWAQKTENLRNDLRGYAFRFAQNHLRHSQGVQQHQEMFQNVMRTASGN